MSDNHQTSAPRRRFLKLVGGGVVVLPLWPLGACSGGGEAPAPADTAGADAPEAEPAAATEPPAPAERPAAGEPATEQAGGGGPMPRLAEDDAQAVSLGYRHEASDVDTSKYPRYQPGQACANCALYQGDGADAWAGCSIFPGKLVKATGWCSVYAPQVG